MAGLLYKEIMNMQKEEKTNTIFIDNVAVNVCFFSVHVQKVTAHVNNVLHNLHKYKIYIIWTRIFMQFYIIYL